MNLGRIEISKFGVGPNILQNGCDMVTPVTHWTISLELDTII